MQTTFTEHVLPNGLRVVCEVMPRVSSASVGFLAATGSRHERPGEHGVSHFLEHMCFKGTARRDWRDINVRFDQLGSIYNAYTGKEHTVYFGWVPAGRVGDQLELLADMMRPRLAAEDFETERKVILEEIAMSADSFDHHVWNTLHESVFGDHSLAHEILGEHDDIANIPRDVMVDYHRRRYAPNNLTLIATGAVEPEEIFTAAARYCGDWTPAANGAPTDGAVPNIRPGVHRRRLEQFKQQSLVLIYPSVPSSSDDGETIEAFQSLFGGANSRCYWNIVQRGICPQAGAAWLSYLDCGMLALYADGEPDRAEEMLSALQQEARAVMERGFSAAEVRRVVNRRRTSLAVESENPRTRMMQIVDDIETRGAAQSAEARLAAVEAVTPQRITRYFERFSLNAEPLLLSCGPRDWPADGAAPITAKQRRPQRRGGSRRAVDSP